MSRYTTELTAPPSPQSSAPVLSDPREASRAPQGKVLRGQYQAPLRSEKGKIKGIILHTPEGSFDLKLPKYLRSMLVRELMPGSWVQVWAFPEDDRWRAINLIPWPDDEVPREVKETLAKLAPPATPGHPQPADAAAPVCLQVCRKGKCFKQGSAHIFQVLQAEIDRNPALQHVSLEATGCMKACKQGPNVRVLSQQHSPQQKMHSRVTPDRALALLADCQDNPKTPATSSVSGCQG